MFAFLCGCRLVWCVILLIMLMSGIEIENFGSLFLRPHGRFTASFRFISLFYSEFHSPSVKFLLVWHSWKLPMPRNFVGTSAAASEESTTLRALFTRRQGGRTPAGGSVWNSSFWEWFFRVYGENGVGS